jgi:hypothetical protein
VATAMVIRWWREEEEEEEEKRNRNRNGQCSLL